MLALAPGLALALGVAALAHLAAPLVPSLPAIVLALILGMALHGVGARATFQPGTSFAVKTLLRWAIALLGLKIAFSDILALGPGILLLCVLAMALTIVATIALSRALGLGAEYGALAGAANAVCGASATLATASVVPDYPRKNADVALTVVLANGVSTLVMLAYPPLCRWLGLDDVATAQLLGLTIHDMAQVVGAGYAVSDTAGNLAVIVKLLRVLLLLPVVLLIGRWFQAQGRAGTAASVPLPGFAFAFIALAALNSVLPATPVAEAYAALRGVLNEAARWGMLMAIAALGIGTSFGALTRVGWRHVAVFSAATLLLLAIALAGIRFI